MTTQGAAESGELAQDAGRPRSHVSAGGGVPEALGLEPPSPNPEPRAAPRPAPRVDLPHLPRHGHGRVPPAPPL